MFPPWVTQILVLRVLVSQVLHGTLRDIACAQEPHFEKHVHQEVTLP